jgi:hypothetical protein
VQRRKVAAWLVSDTEMSLDLTDGEFGIQDSTATQMG